MQVAVVVSGWPRVSEVFALNELLALQRAGMLAAVFATKPGDESLRQPATQQLRSLVHHLPAGDVETQAASVVDRLDGTDVTAIHGYFAHHPAAVAAAAAGRRGVGYGFSVHALDARKISRAEMAERSAGAALVVSCNPDAAAEVEAAGRLPILVRHGVDLSAFSVSAAPNRHPVSLLTVGRFVEKKGFEVLLEALALVERPWQLRVIGDGPLRPCLEAVIARRGLGDRVELVGRCTHRVLPAMYAAADIVVVPSVVDRDGDRDGLPNVVLEAMASGRPVVASDVAAIATAVVDGVTGSLVPPGNAEALQRSLTALIDDPATRHQMGAAGRDVVESEFDLEHCASVFCRTLEAVYG